MMNTNGKIGLKVLIGLIISIIANMILVNILMLQIILKMEKYILSMLLKKINIIKK